MNEKRVLPSAVIIGGHFPSLAAARCLATHKIPVYVIDSEVCLAQFSNSVRRYYRYRGDNEEELLKYLLDKRPEFGQSTPVLFASNDELLRFVSQKKDQLEDAYILSSSGWEAIRYFYDKRLTNSLATKANVPIPDTFYPANREDLANFVPDLPLVLKPAISTHLSAITKKKAYLAENEQELYQYYDLMAAIMPKDEILLQEFIPGGTANLYSYFGFFSAGVPSVGGAAHRLRQHPMDFGRASTFAVTIPDSDMGAIATRLMREISYTGLAEVEFMYHEEHQRFELLDVNPRFWGWLSLAIWAGADLPYLAYLHALGEKGPVGLVRNGVKWMRFTTDLPTALNEMWHGRLRLHDYWRSLRSSRDAVLDWRDPLPFLADLLLVPYYTKHRGF